MQTQCVRIYDVNTSVLDSTVSPADSNDRMLVQSRFADVQNRLKCVFEVDACCDDEGHNSHCAKYYSPKHSFLDAQNNDLAGRCLWINPPYDNIPAFLNKYEKVKATYPNTSAALCLPQWVSAPWYQHVASRYEPVVSYPAGSLLFTKPSEAGKGRQRLGPTRWPVDIW